MVCKEGPVPGDLSACSGSLNLFHCKVFCAWCIMQYVARSPNSSLYSRYWVV